MLDTSKLKQMETRLTQRFSNVARKFGRGLQGAIRFGLTGGAIGVSFAMLSNAILNPLREADEKINTILAKAGDIKTRATQFGTDEAQYFAFQSVAMAKGVEEGDLINIMTRLQTMIGEARLGKENILSAYKNETDMVKVFVEISKVLAGMEATERGKLEAQIFGQRAVGKLESFITSDIEKTAQQITVGRSETKVAQELKRQAVLQEAQSLKATQRSYEEQLDTGRKFNEGTIESQAEAKELENRRVAANVAIYNHLSKLNNKLQEYQIQIAEGIAELMDKEKRKQAVQAGIDMAISPKAILDETKKINTEMANMSVNLQNVVKENRSTELLNNFNTKITELIIAIKEKF
jgi:hypothetical protein